MKTHLKTSVDKIDIIKPDSLNNNDSTQPCYLLYPSHHAVQHPNCFISQIEAVADHTPRTFAFHKEICLHYLKFCFWFLAGALSLIIAVGMASIGITCFLVSLPLAITAVIGFFASLLTFALAILSGVTAYLVCKTGAKALQHTQEE